MKENYTVSLLLMRGSHTRSELVDLAGSRRLEDRKD